MKRIDLTGAKIGLLTVIRRDENRFYDDISKKNNFHYKWHCKCDCGNEILVRTQDLSKQDCKKSCGCNNYMNSVHGNSKYSNPKIVSYKKLYNQYKSHSKIDKKEFLLSLDDSIRLFSSNCHYCNSEPSRKFNVYKTSERYITKNHTRADLAEILVNGIDRINSNIGYIISNVVPCCSSCNYAKHKMPYDDFFMWLDDIANANLYHRNGSKYLNLCFDNTLNSEVVPENIIKKKMNSYVSSARYRKISFELSKIEFSKLIETKCRYCGLFSRKSNYKYKINGIDRINSSLNYTADNCVSCCTECNFAKLNMSEEDFFKWIDKILKYQGYKK